MLKKIKLSPFIKDVALTAVTSISTIFSLIIITRLLAKGFGPEEFGAYSLARRVISVIAPLSTLEISVALVRYLSVSRDEYSRYIYLLSGLFLGIIPGFAFLIIGFIFSTELTLLFFHNKTYSSLFMAMLLWLVGYSFYNVLYAFYRGLNKMGKANLWQLGTVAIGPLAIALVFSTTRKADFMLFLMAICFFAAGIPLAFHCFKGLPLNKHPLKIKEGIKELSQYSLPRVPGVFGFYGLLAFGPFLAPYFGSLKDAGYLVAGQSLLKVIGGGMMAFDYVALPKVGKLFAEGKNEFLMERIIDIIALIFHVGLFATLHLILWSDQIVLVWLGNQYIEAIPLMRVLLLALIPYLAYIMLRSIVNAIETKAINTYNLYKAFPAALLVSFLLAMLGFGVIGLAIGTSIGISVLGVLTIHYLYKFYQLNSATIMIKKCILLNIVFIVGAFVFKYFLKIGFNGLIFISSAVVGEGLLFLGYYLFLRRWNVRWVTELEKRIVSRGGVSVVNI